MDLPVEDATAWSEAIFGSTSLGDKRLTRRLTQIGKQLSSMPGSSLYFEYPAAVNMPDHSASCDDVRKRLIIDPIPPTLLKCLFLDLDFRCCKAGVLHNH